MAQKAYGFYDKNMGKPSIELKNKESVDSFNTALRDGNLNQVSRRKAYLQNIGYL